MEAGSWKAQQARASKQYLCRKIWREMIEKIWREIGSDSDFS